MASPIKPETGFTLIEILIVISLCALLASLLPFESLKQIGKRSLEAERTQAFVMLSEARARALNNIDSLPHGVHFEKNKYTLFRGPRFEENASSNEMYETQNVEVDSPDILFDNLSGSAAVATVTLRYSSSTTYISVSHEGTIE